MTSLTQPNQTTIMTHMTNNQYFIDKSIAILQEMNEEDCAVAIEELRNELERLRTELAQVEMDRDILVQHVQRNLR